MKVGIEKGEVIYGGCRRGIVGLFSNPHSENCLKWILELVKHKMVESYKRIIWDVRSKRFESCRVYRM